MMQLYDCRLGLPVSLLSLSLGLTLLNISAAAQSKYTPPSASASIVSGIPFSSGQALQSEIQQRFVECDRHNMCDGKPLTEYKCSTDPSHNTVFLKLGQQTIFYDAKMGVDADGSELSKTHPGETDQPATSFRYKLPGSPSVNADKVPYIAVPGGSFRKNLGIGLGDVAAVVYKDHVVYAIVADVGPNCKIGEGSIQLHEMLIGAGHGCKMRDEQGVCTKPSNSGIENGVLYFIFTGSYPKIASGLTPQNINDRLTTVGPALMDALKKPAK